MTKSNKIKTIKHPKQVDFDSGISSETLYIKGLSDNDVAKFVKIAETLQSDRVKRVVTTDNKDITTWDLHCAGNSDFLVLNFGKDYSVSNLLLLCFKHYSKFPPTTYVLVEDTHKDYELIKDWVDACHLSITTLDKALKSFKIAVDISDTI